MSKKQRIYCTICAVLLFQVLPLFAQGNNRSDSTQQPLRYQPYTTQKSQREIPSLFFTDSIPKGPVLKPGEHEPIEAIITDFGIFDDWFDDVYKHLLKAVGEEIKVYIIVAGTQDYERAVSILTNEGISMKNIEFIHWTWNFYPRDYAPQFIFDSNNKKGMVDFIYSFDPVDDINELTAALGYMWNIPVYYTGLSLLGGNFIYNGTGVCITLEKIFEDNPSFSREEIQTILRDYCGCERVYTVKGPMYDSVHEMFLDMYARFLDHETIFIGQYEREHENYNAMEKVAFELARVKNENGEPFRIIRIPMAIMNKKIHWKNGTYVNSLFINDKVLVPVYGVPEDTKAFQIYREVLPHHEVIPINCRNFDEPMGALHSLAMEIPAPVWITHEKKLDTDNTEDPYLISATITSVGEMTSHLFWNTIGVPPFHPILMMGEEENVNSFKADIPPQCEGTHIYYYIHAENEAGYERHHPHDAPLNVHRFYIRKVELPPIEPMMVYAGDIITFSFRSKSSSELPLSVNIDPNGLPPGFHFVDFGNGIGYFNWHTTLKDSGLFTPTFSVTNAISSHSQQAIMEVIAPMITTNPESLNFGFVPIGHSRTLCLAIKNIGYGPLSIQEIQTANDVFAVDTTFFTIGGHDLRTLQITFNPAKPGYSDGLLTIVSDALNNPYAMVVLSGQGTSWPIIESTPENFSVFVSEKCPVQQVLTISNLGASRLNFTIRDQPQWIEYEPIRGTVEPKESTDVAITFDGSEPSSDSTYTFDIIISCNDLAHPIVKIPATVTIKRSIGDVSQDGSIDIVDLIFVEYFILGIGPEPTQYQLWAADSNGDCELDILDLIEIGHQMLQGR